MNEETEENTTSQKLKPRKMDSILGVTYQRHGGLIEAILASGAGVCRK